MEAAIKEDFQFYKSVGIAASLLLILLFQLLFPNRLTLRKLLANWRVNAPLALIDTALLSLLCGACVCAWAATVRENRFGFFELARFPYWLQVGATVALLDLTAYLWHRANHVSRFLWRFHSVHHSDVSLEASTAFRFHPGELLISLGIRLLAVTLTGLPILGLIAFEIIYGFFNLFVHSDIRMRKSMERLLGLFFVTPSLHRLHHSERPEELNRNFGTIFSWWDRALRSYLQADADTPIRTGLPGRSGRQLKLGEALMLPFRRGR